MEFKDYYSILGVNRNASPDEIKKARHRLVHLYHPDKNQDDEGCRHKFIELEEAYEVLSDDEKRNKYDTILKEREFGKGRSGAESFSFEGGRHRDFSSMNDMFSDFFSFFFSDSGKPRKRDYRDGDDVHYDDLLK